MSKKETKASTQATPVRAKRGLNRHARQQKLLRGDKDATPMKWIVQKLTRLATTPRGTERARRRANMEGGGRMEPPKVPVVDLVRQSGHSVKLADKAPAERAKPQRAVPGRYAEDEVGGRVAMK